MKETRKLSIVLFAISIMVACGDPANNNAEKENNVTGTSKPKLSKGVGPVKELILKELDPAIADKGEEIFQAYCTACHQIDARKIGPALNGITQRREPEWIMNMILNPENMVLQDDTAKALIAKYIAPMANQNLTHEEARMVLEFFRRNDLKNQTANN